MKEQTTTTRYYVIETEYVGPDEKHQGPSGHYFDITTEPGRTNQSGEVRIEGWLGTTNDWKEDAHGEFETLEQAQAYVEEQVEDGAPELEFEDYNPNDPEGPGVIVERRQVSRYAFEWDAAEWGNNVASNDSDRAGEFGVTAETTDAELEQIAERLQREAEQQADSDGLPLLTGTVKWLQGLRESVRQAEVA